MVENGPDYLKTYDEIQSRKVRWIWYPYIALGKITLLQGDPGDGKSTMMLNLIAELSKAGRLPNNVKYPSPIKSLYQCSEDDAYETIKPRLESFEANCGNVEFIDEEMVENLTLDDEKIREAIVLFKPQLVVIDPLQSYIGEGCSIYTASRARKLMHNLSIWATKYKCAIVLISHFTKNEGTKDLYRGIGSIDVVAAARSVLQVETDSENPNIKRVKQVKNNLAPKGPDVFYELSKEAGFHWLDNEQKETVKSDRQKSKPVSKTEAMAVFIADKLQAGMVPANEILELYKGMQLSDRTIRNAKKQLGIVSIRKDGQWYWSLPNDKGETDT
jgi:Predicted ATP-dependent serine protease